MNDAPTAQPDLSRPGRVLADGPRETGKLTIWRGFVFGLGIALAFLIVEVATVVAVALANGMQIPAVPLRGY